MLEYHIVNRLYENVTTGARSEVYAQACTGLPRVTLNPRFKCPATLPTGAWYSDPFLEVRTVDPETLPRIRSVEPQAGGMDGLIAAIKAAFVNVWKPDKVHVVFHSSGLDSRVLSVVLRELYRERGAPWLGDVLFLSDRWEAPEFRAIMQAQGWHKRQYTACDTGSETDYFRRVLNFEKFWRVNNAPVPLPGRFFGYLIEWAQARGLLPDDAQLQCFNGHGAALDGHDREGVWTLRGDAAKTAARIYASKSESYYTPMYLNYPNHGHENFILAERGVVNAALGWTLKRGSKREVIIKRLCPELRAIPNVGRLRYQAARIPDSVRRDCARAYAASHYARLTGTAWTAPKATGLDARWATWGLASLCEHLHHTGVEVVNA